MRFVAGRGAIGKKLAGKSAQKPRFCARNARKWGFRRTKAHKNLDFVLEIPENGGSEGKKRTKMPILCSGGARSRELFREESGAGWPPRGTRRRGGAAEMGAPRRKRALLLGLDFQRGAIWGNDGLTCLRGAEMANDVVGREFAL